MADDDTPKDNPPTEKDSKKDFIKTITGQAGDAENSTVEDQLVPGLSACPMDANNTDLRQMVIEAEAPYAQCSVHEAEMMEKNIACITCQKLVCALCLRDFHLKHEIMSVIKLRELKQLGGSLEKDLSLVQSGQLKINKQIAEREDILNRIDESKESLISSIEQAFAQLHDILITKQKEVIDYILQYYTSSRNPIQTELDILTERYKDVNSMIKRVLRFFNKLHIMLKESPELPAQLKKMSNNLDGLPPVENEEELFVDCKFDKILPSLHAIANICGSIHPEATKICWSRVTPSKLSSAGEEKKKSPGKENSKELSKESSEDSSKELSQEATKDTAKESEIPAMTPTRVSARNLAKKTTLSQSSTQESNGQGKKNNGKLPTPSKKEDSLCYNHKAAALKRKQMEEAASTLKKPKTGNNSNSVRPRETSTGTNTPIHIKKNTLKTDDNDSRVTGPMNPADIKQEFELLQFDPVHLEPGYAAIVFVNSKVLQIGKVISTSKVKTDNLFEILWYKGDIGKDKIFTLKGDDKAYGVSTDNLICFFPYDFRNAISDILNEEINRAICFKKG